MTDIEEIIKQVRKRNPDVMECDIIRASQWIKEQEIAKT